LPRKLSGPIFGIARGAHDLPSRTLTKQFSNNFLCVAIALVALVATSALLHALFPPAIAAGVVAKLKFFTEHKDEFDTLLLGTSRFQYAISPEIFDQITRENGVPTRTFNFGIDGMHPPENFYVLEQILRTKPRKLKWVFIEVSDIQTRWTDNVLGTHRLVYWHDWPRTALTLKKAFDPRGNARWYAKLARLWLARRDFATNLALFTKQFSNVGRAADFFSSQNSQSASEVAVELGLKRDGYRLAGDAMSAERAVRFKVALAQEIADLRSKSIDPYADEAYRVAAAKIRQVGASTIFVVTPVIWQSLLRFRQSPPPGPLLSFNDSKTYPQLYDTSVRIDEGHLTRAGSEEFTRLLAQEFVRQQR
jgi:hypothetical protein